MNVYAIIFVQNHGELPVLVTVRSGTIRDVVSFAKTQLIVLEDAKAAWICQANVPGSTQVVSRDD